MSDIYFEELEQAESDREQEEYEKYLRAKEGAKPKFHKGKCGNKYDYWTCGNCGVTLEHDVGENYCWSCGYRVKWDIPRCLTGYKEQEQKNDC